MADFLSFFRSFASWIPAKLSELYNLPYINIIFIIFFGSFCIYLFRRVLFDR